MKKFTDNDKAEILLRTMQLIIFCVQNLDRDERTAIALRLVAKFAELPQEDSPNEVQIRQELEFYIAEQERAS